MPPTDPGLFLNPRKCLGTIAYIGVKSNPEPFTWSMIQLVQFCNEYVCDPGEYIHWDHATKSGQIYQRNLLVSRMMGDWILFIDSDHNFEPDLAFRLLSLFTRKNLDVLGGAYLFKEYPHQPMAWFWVDEANTYCQIATWDRSMETLLMGVVGNGCMLIRRTAIEKILALLPGNPFDPIGIYQTDDFDFCERCKQAGIQVWWSPKIECPHLGESTLTMKDYDQDYLAGKQVKSA